MGLNPLWQEDFTLTVQDIFHQALISQTQPYFIISCGERLLVNLISLNNNFSPEELVLLQSVYAKEGRQLVHLWEDIWVAKRNQVLSRITSFLQMNQSFHGRKGKLKVLDSSETKKFLNENHLQGYVKAKYNFGLMNHDQIVALGSFSDARPMPSKGKNYQSAELVRFASLGGITVVGGLSKLIKHFLKVVRVNDLMTYADRDWSLGGGYHRLGFELTENTSPAFMYLNTTTLSRYFVHRLPKSIIETFETQKHLNLDDFLALNGYVKIFNTGNLKYHLFVNYAAK